jgi:hypothetical protein
MRNTHQHIINDAKSVLTRRGRAERNVTEDALHALRTGAREVVPRRRVCNETELYGLGLERFSKTTHCVH